jgi:hypothetical protein
MQKISDDELKLGTIWVALGVARDSFATALRRQKFPEMSDFYHTQCERMQTVRDEIEEQIERLKGLEALDG